ncbi:MAG TPA: transferrin receptor-like dimerization domain-containing protein [Vicinamibacteria bacterium]|nr:transferrin receptor-like dimerization domain-containing protein [Vicinamibacteria bacterium]
MVTRRMAFLAVMGFGLLAAGVRADQGPLGFSDERARAQRALEQRFDSLLKADELREWMRRLSARPHHLGSPYGKENADLLASLFRSWGYDTRIEEFRVLFPTPKTRVLEMLEPTRFTASLAEPALKEDATSGQTSEQLPVYNAYSIDGDVTAPLVYVNYGVPKDYEELARHGVDVKGKIVIARYGGSWRGIKPKVAAEHGAVGCLIYSDPRDDGYFQGDVYPEGAFRNERGAQRGSVADMPLFPGDPLTPGVGATPEAKRLALSEAPTLTKIPVMPISYADAQPLLRALRGPMAPEAWRGALPLTYHLGPGPTKVHLKLAFNWNQVPAYDVIARLRGAERPDEWIVRGNHHDAWVNGANDPISGLVPLLAEAKAIGELHRGGWTPKRTIVFAAWDGEEPGLLGSTEWAEAHADELRQKAAVYINTDSNGRGFLGVGGSHTLERFINEVARDVVDPQTKVSVAERWRARLVMDAKPDDRKEARDRRDLRISALGSGSDFTPFLQHLGIASLNLGYGGEDDGGEYHSIYDSFDLYTRFKDPTFEYGIALAQTVGRAELRLAEADVLPFEFTAFADTISRYVTEVGKLADDMREETEETSRRLRDRTYQLAADPKQVEVPPSPRPSVPYISLAPLQNAKARVDASAKAFEAAAQARAAAGPLPVETQKALDAVLMAAERSLTRAEGLPRRPWFVHQVYAPGFYTGYGVKTLPAVREALEQREWTQAEEQARTVAGVLEAFAAQIDRATAIVSTR